MEKRIILAFILSFAVLYGFRALYTPPASTPEPAAVQTPAVPASTASSTPAPAPLGVQHAPEEPPSPADIRSERSEDVVFDSALYTATVSNAGGVLKSYKLKAYSDAEGHPIELIDAKGGSKLGWPLTLASGDVALDDALTKANYVLKRDGDRIVLEFAGGGIHAKKTLLFDRANYQFFLETTLTKDGKSVPHTVVWRGGFGDQSIPPDPSKRNVVYQSDSAFKRINVASIKDQRELTVPRAGDEDQYFLVMFTLPQGPAPVKIRKEEYPGTDGKPVATVYMATAMPEAKAVAVYAGPKDRQWLAKADPALPGVIDYGFFSFIVRPLTVALLWIHSYVGNFGWAIIILTLVINLALFPLRLKQQISMQKMQKIQPHMRTLQDRYKKLKANDPKRAEVQSQMMALYKEHGVNPMGGCLPLLLQMPFLFAFWSMLSVSIELRRAPWIFWIKDLSQHDPYFIIPILMAISMIVQQKMTPTTVDPAQAKVMMIMPLMFTVMFLWFQSGLTLYWLTSNVFGIGQQIFINKYWSPQAEENIQKQTRQKEQRK